LVTGYVNEVQRPVKQTYVPVDDASWTFALSSVPLPDIAIEFVPLVWSPFTFMDPLYVCAAVGENRTVTGCDPPGAIVPFVQLAEYTLDRPPLMEIPLTVSVEFPLFVIVKDAVALLPTWTLPKARLPIRPMTRAGALDDDGVVGVLFPPPHAAVKSKNVNPQICFSICIVTLNLIRIP
jgi:hypothetical protein